MQKRGPEQGVALEQLPPSEEAFVKASIHDRKMKNGHTTSDLGRLVDDKRAGSAGPLDGV